MEHLSFVDAVDGMGVDVGGGGDVVLTWVVVFVLMKCCCWC